MSDARHHDRTVIGTRRSVLKTGVAAAWAAPAITLVTAAPAMAASGDVILTASGVTADRTGDQLRVQGLLTNTGTQPTDQASVLVAVYTADRVGSELADSTATEAAGFGIGFAGVLGDGFLVRYNTTAPIAGGGGMLAFDSTITLGPVVEGGTFDFRLSEETPGNSLNGEIFGQTFA